MARTPAKPPSKELIVAATVGGARDRFLKASGADWLATFNAFEAHGFADADAAEKAIERYLAKGGDRYVRVEPGKWVAFRMRVSFAPA